MFTVTYTDGTTAEAESPRLSDLVAMEHHFQISANLLQGPEARFEWTAFLIWHRLNAGLNGQGETFEAWLDRVQDFTSPEVAEPDPTNPQEPAE
jgi:hypothetical protein